MLDIYIRHWHPLLSERYSQRKDTMTGTILAVTIALVTSTGLLIHTTIQHARLERAYKELRKVNKILQQRLNNSAERPF